MTSVAASERPLLQGQTTIAKSAGGREGMVGLTPATKRNLAPGGSPKRSPAMSAAHHSLATARHGEPHEPSSASVGLGRKTLITGLATWSLSSPIEPAVRLASPAGTGAWNRRPGSTSSSSSPTQVHRLPWRGKPNPRPSSRRSILTADRQQILTRPDATVNLTARLAGADFGTVHRSSPGQTARMPPAKFSVDRLNAPVRQVHVSRSLRPRKLATATPTSAPSRRQKRAVDLPVVAPVGRTQIITEGPANPVPSDGANAGSRLVDGTSLSVQRSVAQRSGLDLRNVHPRQGDAIQHDLSQPEALQSQSINELSPTERLDLITYITEEVQRRLLDELRRLGVRGDGGL